MRNFIVVHLTPDCSGREIEFTSHSLDLAKDYYYKAIEISGTPRELCVCSGDIQNKLLDNYSIEAWTPRIKKTIEIADQFKRKEHEPY